MKNDKQCSRNKLWQKRRKKSEERDEKERRETWCRRILQMYQLENHKSAD